MEPGCTPRSCKRIASSCSPQHSKAEGRFKPAKEKRQLRRSAASRLLLAAFCCSRQRLAAILCSLEPLPAAAAAFRESAALPARRRPLPVSDWSAAFPSRPRWPLSGQRQVHPVPSGISLVSGSSVSTSLAPQWSAAAPSRPRWHLPGCGQHRDGSAAGRERC